MDAKGYDVDAKGCDVDDKGCGVDAKGYGGKIVWRWCGDSAANSGDVRRQWESRLQTVVQARSGLVGLVGLEGFEALERIRCDCVCESAQVWGIA